MSPQSSPVPTNAASGRVAVERLTALWALAETGLGGALHALRLPLTGLFVGGSAVLLLTLIAHVAREGGLPVRRALLRATTVALVLKAAASPHSPVGAYIAVAFQGAAAAALLPTFGPRFGPFVFAVVALLESAVQKALVLTVLFGAPLWEATDALGAAALTAFGADPAGAGRLSVWLVGLYVGLHAVAGVGIGVLAGRLPAHVDRARRSPDVAVLVREAAAGGDRPPSPVTPRRRSWWVRPAVRRALVVAAGLALFAILPGTPGGPPWASVAVSVVRALTLLAVWTVAVGPVLASTLQRALGRRRVRYARDVARATAHLPRLRSLVPLAWSRSAGRGLAGRVGRFTALIAAAALVDPSPEGRPSP